MLRLRRASLLVAFYLLTSAATAYAECAWVLWEEWSTTQASQRWVLVTGASAESACRNELRDAIRRAERAGTSTGHEQRVEGDPIMSLFRKPSGEVASYGMRRFVCLPDTVDPRSPKIYPPTTRCGRVVSQAPTWPPVRNGCSARPERAVGSRLWRRGGGPRCRQRRRHGAWLLSS